VKRCDEYIAKVVLDYLNTRVFAPNERENIDDIRTKLTDFLYHNTGGKGKMLNSHEVRVEPVKNADESINQQAIDIFIKVNYKQALRDLNLYLVTDDSRHWKEGAKG
jgi:hypothetical protein